MKYLIYARISERGSSSEGETSIDMQLEYCRRYIAERQGEIVREVQDVYISGKSLNRPGIQRILSECRSGAAEWDCLCVYSLSRLTRSPRDLYKVIDVLLDKINALSPPLSRNLTLPQLPARCLWGLSRTSISMCVKSAAKRLGIK